jgi:hypothetical protein
VSELKRFKKKKMKIYYSITSMDLFGIEPILKASLTRKILPEITAQTLDEFNYTTKIMRSKHFQSSLICEKV